MLGCSDLLGEELPPKHSVELRASKVGWGSCRSPQKSSQHPNLGVEGLAEPFGPDKGDPATATPDPSSPALANEGCVGLGWG